MTRWFVLLTVSLLVAATYPFQRIVFSNAPYLVTCFYFGLLISLSCLFGVLLGISNSSWRPLFLIPLAGLAGMSTAYVDGPFQLSEFLLPSLTTIFIILLLESLKFACSARVSNELSERVPLVLQFNVSGLLVLTAAVATTFGVFEFLGRIDGNYWGYDFSDLSIFTCFLVFMTCSTTWLLLGFRRWSVGVLALPVSVLGFFATMVLAGNGIDEWYLYGCSLSVCWAIVFAQLVSLKAFGFRIVPANV